MGAKKTSTAREYLEALLIAGAFLGFSNTFVVKTFYIPSASMETTLLVGDHLFVNRFIYGNAANALERKLLPSRKIRRGDIVIFRSPDDKLLLDSPDKPLLDMVKRCIGLPGDVIEMDSKDLYINGQWVEDGAYTRHLDARILPGRDTWGPLTVPADHYFCMGDNRDNSKDSRYWGMVPSHFVKGRAFLIYWSFGGKTSDGVWRGLGHRLKLLGETVLGFFTRTRWRRTFSIVR